MSVIASYWASKSGGIEKRLFMNRVYILYMILVLSLIQGCASFVGHYDYMTAERGNEPTAYYPGVVTDCAGIGLALSAPFMAPFYKDRHIYEIIVLPLALIDLPFSFVLDTLFLPSDIWEKIENRPYNNAEKEEAFWDEAFLTDILTLEEARQNLTEWSEYKVTLLLDADKDGNASNVVDVLFKMAVTNNDSIILAVLSRQRSLSPVQYHQLYTIAKAETPNDITFDIDSYTTHDIEYHLVNNPSIPNDLLITLAALPGAETSIAALQTGRLPLSITTNLLTRFAHSKSSRKQYEAARNSATLPEILIYLSTIDIHPNSLVGSLEVTIARNQNCPVELLERFACDEDRWLRKAVAEHPSTPLAILKLLCVDTDSMVRSSAKANPERHIQESEQ